MSEKTKLPKAPTWDLDSLFPGGSSSPEFKKHREETTASMEKIEKMAQTLDLGLDDNTANDWAEFILQTMSICEDIELIISFAGCLSSQNVSDKAADALTSEGYVLYSRWEKLKTQLEAAALKQKDENWNKLLSDSRLSGIQFYLNELREIAKSKMPVEMESLALELSVNGYHAWDQLYTKMSGELVVDFESDGKTEKLSLGQLATKMSDPNREIRKQAFEKMTGAWKSREELAGMMLNSMAGFRLSLYERRGWESPLDEPLRLSRMSKKTLDTMWDVIGKNIDRLLPYIEAKKKLLKIDKYSWYDQFAPCGAVDKTYSFEEAGQFLDKNVRGFSNDMADFMKMALDKRWVEAEDRSGKRGGAYCTGTGKFKQTRVFMTYAGNYENLLTLAHELGHAYHGWVLKDRPYYAQSYPMNLAETASTFAEALVTDAALSQTTDSKEKLMLLDQNLQGTHTMFCDIHSRYLFDRSFYEKRKKGVLSTNELRELMINAQKKAFGPLLDESGYHPLFWCTKLHFYITDAPFYNFPYTFGFLFSGGIYAQAKKEGAGFEDKYKALLADTGSMTTEEVAKKHLGVDLTSEAFWQGAVDNALKDVDEFVKLAETLL